MPRRSSQALHEAMALLRANPGLITPRQAAIKIGIALSTMYRSSEYKTWRAAQEKLKAQARRD